MSDRVLDIEGLGPVQRKNALAYFERISKGRSDLEPMSKPCPDCPVVSGMYAPYSDLLSHMPQDTIEKSSQTWFCHMNPKRSCRGNIDFQIEKNKGGELWPGLTP